MDEQSRVEAEVRGLTIRLMRAPYGRPAAAVRRTTRRGRHRASSSRDSKMPIIRRTITRALEASGPGCKWLLKGRAELEERLSDERRTGRGKCPSDFALTGCWESTRLDATFSSAN